ncbi:MAG: hypothetical protein BWY25_02104 [Chloroflexi bacterium ADurb.Bin222]|nr:MAG: hypothetical protein BWY25_02104 [Chloroflexi bacterium ADurb.Bin222]
MPHGRKSAITVAAALHREGQPRGIPVLRGRDAPRDAHLSTRRHLDLLRSLGLHGHRAARGETHLHRERLPGGVVHDPRHLQPIPRDEEPGRNGAHEQGLGDHPFELRLSHAGIRSDRPRVHHPGRERIRQRHRNLSFASRSRPQLRLPQRRIRELLAHFHRRQSAIAAATPTARGKLRYQVSGIGGNLREASRQAAVQREQRIAGADAQTTLAVEPFEDRGRVGCRQGEDGLVHDGESHIRIHAMTGRVERAHGQRHRRARRVGRRLRGSQLHRQRLRRRGDPQFHPAYPHIRGAPLRRRFDHDEGDVNVRRKALHDGQRDQGIGFLRHEVSHLQDAAPLHRHQHLERPLERRRQKNSGAIARAIFARIGDRRDPALGHLPRCALGTADPERDLTPHRVVLSVLRFGDQHIRPPLGRRHHDLRRAVGARRDIESRDHRVGVPPGDVHIGACRRARDPRPARQRRRDRLLRHRRALPIQRQQIHRRGGARGHHPRAWLQSQIEARRVYGERVAPGDREPTRVHHRRFHRPPLGDGLLLAFRQRQFCGQFQQPASLRVRRRLARSNRPPEGVARVRPPRPAAGDRGGEIGLLGTHFPVQMGIGDRPPEEVARLDQGARRLPLQDILAFRQDRHLKLRLAIRRHCQRKFPRPGTIRAGGRVGQGRLHAIAAYPRDGGKGKRRVERAPLRKQRRRREDCLPVGIPQGQGHGALRVGEGVAHVLLLAQHAADKHRLPGTVNRAVGVEVQPIGVEVAV